MSAFLTSSCPLKPGDAVAALILIPDGRYLLQLRDDIPEIFFPGHWALFGGGIEPGETDRQAVVREVMEEIGLLIEEERFQFFTNFTFDFSFAGASPNLKRVFFEVTLTEDEVARAVLGEGAAMEAFTGAQALGQLKLTPYDSFALWMHHARSRIVC